MYSRCGYYTTIIVIFSGELSVHVNIEMIPGVIMVCKIFLQIIKNIYSYRPKPKHGNAQHDTIVKEEQEKYFDRR